MGSPDTTSRLGRVFVAESTVLRVLAAARMHLPGLPAVREKRPKTPWPDWVEMVPGQIYIYDFTHFSGLRGWCTIAVVDVVSRYWLSTVLAPEETWVQVETAFIAALEADGKGWLLEGTSLAEQLASGQIPDNDDRLPMLLAVSDNGPQMRSSKIAEFMAIARIAQHFGRPGTPNDHRAYFSGQGDPPDPSWAKLVRSGSGLDRFEDLVDVGW